MAFLVATGLYKIRITYVYIFIFYGKLLEILILRPGHFRGVTEAECDVLRFIRWIVGRHSSVGIATCYWLNSLRIESRWG
jgi:hypothetical protein